MSSKCQVADFVKRSNQLVEVVEEVVTASKAGIHGMKTPVWMGHFFMPGAFLTVRKAYCGQLVVVVLRRLT